MKTSADFMHEANVAVGDVFLDAVRQEITGSEAQVYADAENTFKLLIFLFLREEASSGQRGAFRDIFDHHCGRRTH